MGQIQDTGTYTLKYTTSIAPIGDEQMLGQAMARVASVHLIGDPLGSEAFQDATSIQTSLETASTQTFNQGNTAFYNALAVQLSKVLGGSKSSAPMNPGIQIGSDPIATPYDVTSQTSSITGQTYSSSSEQHVGHTTYGDDVAFSGISSAGAKWWLGGSGTYSSGTYSGNNVLSGVHGVVDNSWNGFWIQVDIGQTVVLSEYKIHPRHNTTTVKNTPREGYLLSSLDGMSWNEIHHLNLDDTTGRLLYYDSGYGSADTDLTALNNREGRYFAFVFKKVFTNSDQSYGGIGELELLGVTKAEFDGGSPPAAYDVASSNSTLNGQSYSSSHYYDTSWLPSEAFDNTTSNASAWLTPNGSFTQATGELAPAYETTTFTAGAKGEWIGVDVGQKVYATKFLVDGRHHTHDAYRNNNPREFTLYGSKDLSLIHI